MRFKSIAELMDYVEREARKRVEELRKRRWSVGKKA